MSDDLVAFLRARLDEDEAAAKTAQVRRPGPWAVIDPSGLGNLHFATEIHDPQGKPVAVVSGGYITSHIVRHDPARVLRDVEAKRRILAEHEDTQRGYVADHGVNELMCVRCADADRDGDPYAEEPYPCPTLRALAAVYFDHPDCRPEWRPLRRGTAACTDGGHG